MSATDHDADDGRRVATRWRRIAEDLESDIRGGKFEPGTPLPTVVALADRFDVNRHTVRQALQFLQARGLVSVEQGRGTFVRSRIYDYRLGRRVRFRNNFSGERADVSGELVSMGIEPLGAKEAQRLNLPEGTPAWAFRVLRVVDGMPLSTSFHRLSAARFPDFDKVFAKGGASLTQAFREFGITDYVRLATRINAVMPTDEEQELLQIAPTRPILLTRGVDGLPNGEAFHTTTTAFVGDRIELVVEPEDGGRSGN